MTDGIGLKPGVDLFFRENPLYIINNGMIVAGRNIEIKEFLMTNGGYYSLILTEIVNFFDQIKAIFMINLLLIGPGIIHKNVDLIGL